MTMPLVNVADVAFRPRAAAAAVPEFVADRFEARFARIGQLLGASQLGYNIIAAPPGKRALPRHNHRVNEEMFFVPKGTGDERIDANLPDTRGRYRGVRRGWSRDRPPDRQHGH